MGKAKENILFGANSIFQETQKKGLKAKTPEIPSLWGRYQMRHEEKRGVYESLFGN